MVTNASILVKEILQSGFQVEPKAFELIQRTEEKEMDVRRLIQEVIENKLRSSAEHSITAQDLAILLPVVKIGDRALGRVGMQARVEIIRRNEDVPVQLLEGKKGFENLFKSRYKKLMHIAGTRPDFFRIEKISQIQATKRQGARKVAGLVMSKRLRRNNIVVTIDDETGILEALALDKQIIEDVKQVPLDSLIILDVEFSGRNTAIIKSVHMPDVPEHKSTRADERVYAVFTSDLHVGSKNFLKEPFEQFVSWLNNTNDEVVSKIRYLVIAGDSIDGIGVYPGQEADLEYHDTSKQYAALAYELQRIPKFIKIFIIPGNHDPVRQALPQPVIPKKYAEDLYNLDNVTILGNPSWLSLHSVNILVYHGRSLDDIMATTPGITFNRPALAMRSLLRARHLAPIYGERTSVIPETEDTLVIDQVPDIFHAGHIHTLDSENYRGTLILNSGAWQAQTPFQAKMGIIPTPAIVPIVDLSSMDVFTRDFRHHEDDNNNEEAPASQH